MIILAAPSMRRNRRTKRKVWGVKFFTCWVNALANLENRSFRSFTLEWLSNKLIEVNGGTA